MRARPRRRSLRLAFSLATSLAIVPARAEVVQGVLEALPTTCEAQTHGIVDVCGESALRVGSFVINLDAHACQHVQAEGAPSGLVCPGLDLQTLSVSAPACPIEVRGLEVMIDPRGTVVFWPRLVCSDSYDVIRGVLGVPAFDACDDLHRCASDFYCDRRPGDCGGVGSCAPKPPACTAVFDPVCGCDGLTYGNSCEAAVRDVAVACQGICPCPAACIAPGGCLDVGPVTCGFDDIPAFENGTGILDPETPAAGQAFFYLVRASGRGVVGVTTYGFTTDGRERLFAGDCPR